MKRRDLLALSASLCAGMTAAPAAHADMFTDLSADQLYAKAKTEGGITFYTSQVGISEQQIASVFKKQYPGIDVEVVYAGGGALFQKLTAEANAGRDQADVHLQSDIDMMEQLRTAGLLAQWSPPAAQSYAASDKKDGCWTVVANVYYVITYSKLRLKPADAPKSWTELLDPKWRDKIAATDIGGGGGPWSLFYFLRHDVAPDYWTKMAANKPIFFDGGGGVINAVVSGKADIGLVPDSVSYGAIQGGAPLTDVLPAEGLPGVQYTIAVMKKAKSPYSARLFENWYLSKEGQTALVKIRGVSSPRKDVGITSTLRTSIPNSSDALSMRAAWTKDWLDLFKSGQ